MSNSQINDDGSTTIILEYPIKTKDGKAIDEVTLKRATVGDIAKADGAVGDIAATVAIIASLSGLAPSEVRKLDMLDFMAMQEIAKVALEGKSGSGSGEG